MATGTAQKIWGAQGAGPGRTGKARGSRSRSTIAAFRRRCSKRLPAFGAQAWHSSRGFRGRLVPYPLGADGPGICGEHLHRGPHLGRGRRERSLHPGTHLPSLELVTLSALADRRAGRLFHGGGESWVAANRRTAQGARSIMPFHFWLPGMRRAGFGRRRERRLPLPHNIGQRGESVPRGLGGFCPGVP